MQDADEAVAQCAEGSVVGVVGGRPAISDFHHSRASDLARRLELIPHG